MSVRQTASFIAGCRRGGCPRLRTARLSGRCSTAGSWLSRFRGGRPDRGRAPRAAADQACRPSTRCALRSPTRTSTSSWPTGSRTATTANDTGGIAGGPNEHGFDPTHRGFYNGGDLKGLLDQIDYIQGLGTTSIWLTPSFKNKAVQLEDGPSAGYHGYWITDFTQIDPHLGTNAELRALVDEAHERGMKVYFDIITNHTADVIGYEEGARTAYVPKDVEPYRTASGRPFDDRDYAGTNTLPAARARTSPSRTRRCWSPASRTSRCRAG